MRLQRIRWFAAIAFSLLGFLPQSGLAADFKLSLDRREIATFKSDEIIAMNRFLSEVSGKLPEKMKQDIGGEIRIRFADIESDWFNRCEWNQIMGFKLSSSQGRVITLERSLGTAMIHGGSFPRGCGYGSPERFAMATLIREIALVYDRQAGLSKDPRIQTLLGAAEIGGILPKRRVGEEISERSPDVSEFESPSEGLAVNIARYAMDPEFECRRPALAHALAHALAPGLGWNPYPAKPCEINTVVPLSQEELSSSAVRFVRLDPKRLYQVHYLFASQGKETMSRWGHAMYRLVFCAPERTTPGPDCLKDVSYHVVVSFRANVQGYEVNPLKGMNGDYPSQLYLLSLLEVMREYNEDELRDLISLPLNLSADQTREFLFRSLQLFWEYRGRYQFLSNNCATEALNLLKSVIGDPEFHKGTHVVTPIGLYDALKRSGLMSESFVQDKKQAKEQGYLFPSVTPRLERAFQEIRQKQEQGQGRSIRADLDSYLEDSKASDRMAEFKERRLLASQFFILESYLVRKQQTAFFKQVVAMLQDGNSRAQIDPNGTLLHLILQAKALEESLTPPKLAPKGYGISLPSDFQADLESKINQARLELKQITETLRQALETHFADRYQELLQTVENRRVFARAMNAMKE
jgi:hypothetical protein